MRYQIVDLKSIGIEILKKMAYPFLMRRFVWIVCLLPI